MKDYYAILEVSSTASPEVIKAVYRALAKKYHPDINPNLSAKEAAYMQEVNEAYEVLSDPDKKRLYDSQYDSHQHCHANSSSTENKTATEEKARTEYKEERPNPTESTNSTANKVVKFAFTLGSAFVASARATAERQARERENSYTRASHMSDGQLLREFKIATGPKKVGLADVLVERGYLYKDEDEQKYHLTSLWPRNT